MQSLKKKQRNLLLPLPAPLFIVPSKLFRVLKVQMFRRHNRRGLRPQKPRLLLRKVD